jgi:uncharacterized protein
MTISRRCLLGQLAWPAVLASGQTARSSRALETRIQEALEKTELVDTHEHLIPEKERVAQNVDFFTLAGHYAINDVISAGLAGEDLEIVRRDSEPADRRWRAFELFWRHARFTGYGQALRIAIRDIYGIETIDGSTLPRINRAIAEKNKPGLYENVLRERARIRLCVVDDYWNEVPTRLDQPYFVLAHKFDRFVTPASAADIARLEKIANVSITSLATLKQALEKNFTDSLGVGMVTVKSTMAYNRTLLFREVSEADAARDFDALMKGGTPAPEGFRRNVERPWRILEDHLFHHVVRLADAHNVPFQIHTGLHAGNGNFVENSRPTQLTNLFFLYPRVRFDLFHMSYPYEGELAVLAKLFRNVYVDMCWAHIVSPSASRRALHEFLDTVPANKIMGFGGDYRYPELTYAHAKMARRNIAMVLAEKVEDGFASEVEAVELGRMLLDDNPAALFDPARRVG